MSYCTRKAGYRHRIVERARRQWVRLFTSGFILDELETVLIRDLGLSRRYAHLARRAVGRLATTVRLPEVTGSFVPGDSDDDPVVQTARTAKADCLVTTDGTILNVHKVRDVEVITIEEFEARLGPDPGTR